MINVIYCPDHGGTKTVVAAGTCELPATHTHGDETNHTCSIVTGVNEPNISGQWPILAGDDTTTINSTAEWFTYLEQYVP